MKVLKAVPLTVAYKILKCLGEKLSNHIFKNCVQKKQLQNWEGHT